MQLHESLERPHAAEKEMQERLGDTLVVVKLPGKGNPIGFRLKPEEGEDEKATAPLPQKADEPSETGKDLGHTLLPENPELPQKTAAKDDAAHLVGATEGEL